MFPPPRLHSPPVTTLPLRFSEEKSDWAALVEKCTEYIYTIYETVLKSPQNHNHKKMPHPNGHSFFFTSLL